MKNSDTSQNYTHGALLEHGIKVTTSTVQNTNSLQVTRRNWSRLTPTQFTTNSVLQHDSTRFVSRNFAHSLFTSHSLLYRLRFTAEEKRAKKKERRDLFITCFYISWNFEDFEGFEKLKIDFENFEIRMNLTWKIYSAIPGNKRTIYGIGDQRLHLWQTFNDNLNCSTLLDR